MYHFLGFGRNRTLIVFEPTRSTSRIISSQEGALIEVQEQGFLQGKLIELNRTGYLWIRRYQISQNRVTESPHAIRSYKKYPNERHDMDFVTPPV